MERIQQSNTFLLPINNISLTHPLITTRLVIVSLTISLCHKKKTKKKNQERWDSVSLKMPERTIRQCFIRDVLICELDSLKEIGFVDWEDNREVWLEALYPPLIGASISFAKHDNIHHLGFDLQH